MTPKKKIIVVLKGYPRLSETFIAQELLGLERAGFDLALVALRRPTDKKRHPVHDEIRASVHYLPEYLHEEPLRVLRALVKARRLPGFRAAWHTFLKDFRRDFTRNRVRRLGQAAVLAAEWPERGEWLHAHFIHTPASVTQYASLMTGIPWTCSAHAKDIWTSPDWELAGKLTQNRWTVTCTKSGYEHLKTLANGHGAFPGKVDTGFPPGNAPESRVGAVHLSYHGLDLDRFGVNTTPRPARDGSNPADPVTILSVGRAVPKKGYDILLKALARLPADLHWRFEHIGSGPEIAPMKALASELGISERTDWRGALDQKDVLAAYRKNDLFALACRITADGDRDGLPNVLVEASSQNLPCISTSISGVPELIINGENGLLVEPENPEQLAVALEKAIRDPGLRQRLGEAAETRVRAHFDHHASIRQLAGLFEKEWEA